MKRYQRNLIILVFPFLLMVLVNESVRPTIKETHYTIWGAEAMNSAVQSKELCTWNCHNNTVYCMENHLGFLKSFKVLIDPLYFGMISALQQTGNYGMANLVFLGVLWPLLMYLLLIRSLNIQEEIRAIKRKRT